MVASATLLDVGIWEGENCLQGSVNLETGLVGASSSLPFSHFQFAQSNHPIVDEHEDFDIEEDVFLAVPEKRASKALFPPSCTVLVCQECESVLKGIKIFRQGVVQHVGIHLEQLSYMYKVQVKDSSSEVLIVREVDMQFSIGTPVWYRRGGNEYEEAIVVGSQESVAPCSDIGLDIFTVTLPQGRTYSLQLVSLTAMLLNGSIRVVHGVPQKDLIFRSIGPIPTSLDAATKTSKQVVKDKSLSLHREPVELTARKKERTTDSVFETRKEDTMGYNGVDAYQSDESSNKSEQRSGPPLLLERTSTDSTAWSSEPSSVSSSGLKGEIQNKNLKSVPSKVGSMPSSACTLTVLGKSRRTEKRTKSVASSKSGSILPSKVKTNPWSRDVLPKLASVSTGQSKDHATWAEMVGGKKGHGAAVQYDSAFPVLSMLKSSARPCKSREGMLTWDQRVERGRMAEEVNEIIHQSNLRQPLDEGKGKAKSKTFLSKIGSMPTTDARGLETTSLGLSKSIELPSIAFGKQFLIDAITGRDGRKLVELSKTHNCTISFYESKPDCCNHNSLMVLLVGSSQRTVTECSLAIEETLFYAVPPALRGSLLVKLGRFNSYREERCGIVRSHNPFFESGVMTKSRSVVKEGGLYYIAIFKAGPTAKPLEGIVSLADAKRWMDDLKQKHPLCQMEVVDASKYRGGFPGICSHIVLASPRFQQTYNCREELRSRLLRRKSVPLLTIH